MQINFTAIWLKLFPFFKIWGILGDLDVYGILSMIFYLYIGKILLPWLHVKMSPLEAIYGIS